jgi:hypothetical protein
MNQKKQPKQFDIKQFNYTYSNGMGQSTKTHLEEQPEELDQNQKSHARRESG